MYNNVPNRMPEPPPAAMKEFELDLMDADCVVGWIRPHAIAFVGFANEVEAAHAAALAHRLLARRIALREGRRPMPIAVEPVRLQGAPGDRAILSSAGEIAQLIEPRVGDASDAGAHGDSYGFALVLPARTNESSVRAKAQMIYRGLRRSGIRWALWSPRPRVEQHAPAPLPVANRDRDIVVGDPLPIGQLAVSVLLLVLAVLAVAVPASLAGVLAIAALVGLMGMRFSVALRFLPVRSRAGSHSFPFLRS